MDAGVVADSRPQAFASRTAAERVKRGPGIPGAYGKFSAAGRKATAAAESRAGHLRRRRSSPMLSHRHRRVSWHLTHRRSQRHPTPFFSNLLRVR